LHKTFNVYVLMKPFTRVSREVGPNFETYQRYADAAYERYVKSFSGEAIVRRLDEMMNQDVEGHGND
jgi:hypothetical protein